MMLPEYTDIPAPPAPVLRVCYTCIYCTHKGSYQEYAKCLRSEYYCSTESSSSSIERCGPNKRFWSQSGVVPSQPVSVTGSVSTRKSVWRIIYDLLFWDIQSSPKI